MPATRTLLLPLVRATLAGTSALALVAAAHAQEAQQEDTTSSGDSTALETLVVNGGSGGVITADGYVGISSATGAKVDTPFLETPQSISSVTEQQLRDRNPQTLLETLAYTPGTWVNAYGFDPRFDSFYVRGFDVTYTGVFRDNLRQPAAGSSLFKNEPYGLEGVSILRGPSSALYGATGAGGLYNLITKRATEEAVREVQIQVGTHDRYQGQFDFSGPVNETDPVYYRLTGLLRDSNTEQISVPDDRAYIAPAFTWKPDEDTKLTILGEYTRTKTGGTAANYNDFYYGGFGSVTDIFLGDPAFNDSIQNQGRIGYEFEHSVNEALTFRQNLRLSTLHIDAQYVYGYGPFIVDPLDPDNPYDDVLDPTRIGRMAGVFDERLTSMVVDNQLESNFATGIFDHTLLAGIDVAKLRYKALGGEAEITPIVLADPNFGAPIATPAFTSNDKQDQWQLGTYLQDQIRYEAWTLTVGGRYDWVWTDSSMTDLTTDTTTDVSQNDKAFSGRIGLTYETDFGLAPYASYSTAFSPNVGINGETNQPFKPTESTQQEIGVKYLLSDYNVLLTAALFNIDQENGVFWEVIGTKNRQVQRGKLRSRGLELEATTSLDNGLSLTAAYSYTNVKILEGAAGTVGNHVSSTPFHLASIWADYTMPEDSVAEGLGFGFGARYIGSSYGDDYNTLKNDARVLFDASVHYDFAAIDKKYEGLQLQVNATNLFDRRDITCTSNYCYRDQGRTVIGSLRYNW
ncbi:TonB-dependent siderophore receptor [Sinorhizobium terangae]|uniref:TonB-dependent siderophore receptor n=1 Tax=Sinorhizobium terangae TaxID=110322 RepID=A0A6N7LGG2_SINTE|nr:TonB-dependent siderophore receptor [Sinorhizobium terangae]MBB4185427.1 iron complex outermembrane receptor protein [Sinorhizobium terangae]MQX16862.1 TonB-dependent siderophore receptor [Sinorhizobium terangae]WFU46498.1 TonB-dependent siderophore receptor [Sinorhizobium terangae]